LIPGSEGASRPVAVIDARITAKEAELARQGVTPLDEYRRLAAEGAKAWQDVRRIGKIWRYVLCSGGKVHLFCRRRVVAWQASAVVVGIARAQFG
jgi:hypothetical protein